MSKLLKIIKKTSPLIIAPIIGFNWFLGAEPQISNWDILHNIPRENFTINEYVDATKKEYGNSPIVEGLAYSCYPGAKIGRLIHNSMVD